MIHDLWLPSQKQFEEIERSEIEYMTDRMTAIQGRAGNPEGIKVQRFGHAVCFYSRTMPWGQFNTVKGLRDADLDRLDEMIAWYRSRERQVQFELVPSLVSSHLLKRLADSGYYQSGFHASLYVQLDASNSDSAGRDSDSVHIRELREDELEVYAAIHCRAFGLSDEGIPPVAANNRVLYGRRGWKFFLALVNGEPAAVGVLYVQGQKASLTSAATLPAYRNIGLHQSLIRRRMTEAAAQNCTLLVGQCAPASQSQRNMERAGMKIGYIKTIWTAIS